MKLHSLNPFANHRLRNQVTLRREIRVEGVGLHSGKRASITLKPALPNTGILFIRKDLPQAVALPATFEYVSETRLATTLGQGQGAISTVEHLLCAFRLMGVDNALVEVMGPEVPIMDGSAEPFCQAILDSGFFEQSAAKKYAFLKKRVEVRKGDKVASISPGPQLSIHAKIEWNHPVIGVQELDFELGKSNPLEISRARTFGFMRDVEKLKSLGLIQGGSLENAVVMDEEQVLNPNGLRYRDEFVRHKVLDAIGDFSLAPIPLIGRVSLVKAGHELHAELVSAVFSNPDNFEVKTLDEFHQENENLKPVLASNWVSNALQSSYR